MSQSYIEQSPENVVWFNLNLGAYQLSLRRALSVAATAGLMLLWFLPTAVISAIANSKQLLSFWWMQWLNGDSAAKRLLQGVITGVLPPVLLALLNMALPSVLRCESLDSCGGVTVGGEVKQLTLAVIVTFQGTPSKKAVELDVMTRYFVFLVVVSLEQPRDGPRNPCHARSAPCDC